MKFTKSKAVELYSIITGHNKSFLNKNVTADIRAITSYRLNVGLVRYDAWKSNGRIYVQVALGGEVRDSYWFDLETLERDFGYQEKCDEEIRQEIRGDE